MMGVSIIPRRGCHRLVCALLLGLLACVSAESVFEKEVGLLTAAEIQEGVQV